MHLAEFPVTASCMTCPTIVPLDPQSAGWIVAELTGNPPKELWLCPNCAEEAKEIECRR
jgi:hypothetical protein